nr:PDZ domain-containing protein [Flavisolibacter sp.]
VIEGRAAHKAGLQPGDIVTALGNTNVSSMEAYMQALSRFNKGDKTSVTFSRKNQVLSTAVEF